MHTEALDPIIKPNSSKNSFLNNIFKTLKKILFFLFLFLFLIGLVFIIFITNNLLKGNESFVPSNPNQFDVTETYTKIHEFVGLDYNIVSIEAYLVSSQGVLNLNSNSSFPQVKYEFEKQLDKIPNDKSFVNENTLFKNGKWYQQINVSVSKPTYLNIKYLDNKLNINFDWGMKKETLNIIEPVFEYVNSPICSYKQLWQTAITHDSSIKAFAIIKFDKNGYTFSIPEQSISLQFDKNCKIKLI